ncbi:uncharacterized protein LOC121967976 [Zingiber officinale]|uniref:Uncharacterized protein n=1 Tax=Zingiber officinale TaxID=94328 RepID=A0A8J5HA69_ZINOF|nr:uncharacterized protein LOC121967976 [Zingiber officinale]KAG6517182.1 hypothetical protein ZIOFF_020562 [Zingiber officinale]
MEESGGWKRGRDEGGEEGSSPEAKRFRDDLLRSILEGDDDASGSEVASVMKSLEEEISLPSAPVPGLAASDQPDLGYLLEASDDELGLPPAASSSSGEGCGASEAAIAVGDGGEVDGVEFGQIWGFADEMDGYSGLGCGIRPEDKVEAAAAEGLVYDAGLFNYSDDLYAPSDLPEFSWRY